MRSKSGRPSVINQSILRKLEEAFLNGATDLEACYIAGISKTTLYDYQDKNSDFSERKAVLKGMLKYQAKINISKQIKRGDIKLSQWYLERTASDEFGKNVSIKSQDNMITGINYILPSELVDKHGIK